MNGCDPNGNLLLLGLTETLAGVLALFGSGNIHCEYG